MRKARSRAAMLQYYATQWGDMLLKIATNYIIMLLLSATLRTGTGAVAEHRSGPHPDSKVGLGRLRVVERKFSPHPCGDRSFCLDADNLVMNRVSVDNVIDRAKCKLMSGEANRAVLFNPIVAFDILHNRHFEFIMVKHNPNTISRLNLRIAHSCNRNTKSIARTSVGNEVD